MSEKKRPIVPKIRPEYVPPRMRREELREPDGRRLLLYHFDRPASPRAPQTAEKKELTDG
jgi:hypothetical protein